jgi:hypothetical protein
MTNSKTKTLMVIFCNLKETGEHGNPFAAEELIQVSGGND